MELLKELEEQAKNLNAAALDGLEEGETLLSPDEQDLAQGELIKKQIINRENFELGIYPPKSQFIDHLRANWKLSQHIKRSTLNVGGRLVHDSFEKYLHDTKVRIDENGKLVLDENGDIAGYFQSSDLKAANKTPRHLFFKLAPDLIPKKDNAGHFDLGEALHACLMEPTRFSRYVVEPTDSKASNVGCDVHMEFWKEKLFDALVKQEGGPIDGKLKYAATLDMIIADLGLIRVKEIVDFLKRVESVLDNAKSQVYEGSTFTALIEDIQLCFNRDFPLGIKFADKVTDDPYQIIIKELGLKKNESLGESKKGFDPEPKLNLLENLKGVIRSYLSQYISFTAQDVAFRNLEEKKNFIEALKTASGLESVNENQYTIIKALELNAKTYGNGIIYKLARHAHRECSAYLDDYDGLPLKVRPDMLQFEENIGVNAIISVKSTSSENIEKFFYDTAKYQYELSEGMYSEVLTKVTGREFRSIITIMYQTVEPWGVAVFWWKPEDIELGRHKFIQAHRTLKDTIEKEMWPGYDIYAEEGDFGVIDMALPWWAYKSLEERNQEGLDHVHSSGEL